MPELKIYQPRSIDHYIARREGETKLGEKIKFISTIEDLNNTDADFVLLGIPEDIGVRANRGKAGTSNAWSAALKALLNIQNNEYFPSEKLLLLGEIDCSAEMNKASHLESSDPNYYIKLGELVESIDETLSEVVRTIISAGKIPVIIGGGHNNAFGNIKGAAEGFNTAINVMNIDAHTDLRRLEHRHSGNGFSYALKKGHLKKYAVFGLHQNYTPQYIFDEMNVSEKISYYLFEDLISSDKEAAFEEELKFVASKKFGLEVDCDSISAFPSSAITPSGFSLDEIRSFIRTAANSSNCCYLHICEAIASSSFPTGKALSTLLTDFIKERAYA